jgi:hypothetical protein
MQHFRIRTLVDITRTGVFKEHLDPLAKKQQDNFQTLHQTLEIRGNVYFDRDPQQVYEDWSGQGFGKKERSWVWEIYIEQDDLFLIDSIPFAAMLNDVDFIPFNIMCNETAKFKTNSFSTRKKPINILFEYIDK